MGRRAMPERLRITSRIRCVSLPYWPWKPAGWAKSQPAIRQPARTCANYQPWKPAGWGRSQLAGRLGTWHAHANYRPWKLAG